jgi:hypothetical protein
MPAKGNSPEVAANSQPSAPFRAFLQRLEIEATLDTDGVNQLFIDGVTKILAADTEEEMWDADDLLQTGGRDLADVEQTIISYEVKRSRNPDIKSAFRAEDGRYMFLLIRSVKLETGDEFTWNTSAPYLVAKIIWLADHDRLPYDAVIKATDLGAGQAVLKLKPIPKRAMRVTAEPVF